MASKDVLPLVFLPSSGAETPRRTQLTSAARAQASRQGHLKSARARNVRFVSWHPETGDGRANKSSDAGPSMADDILDDEIPSRSRGDRNDKALASPRGWISSWDPFNAFAAQKITIDEQLMLNYAFTNTWTAFGESPDGKNRFAQTWMWRTMESPATLYAQALASSTHYLISCPKATDQKRMETMALRWKVEAIRALRVMMRQYDGYAPEAIPEDVLVAIFVLAIHGGHDLSQRRDLDVLSPLAPYRDMSIYGRMRVGEEHMNALYYLIEKRGGLDKVDQQTFGSVLPLLDILHNSRLGKTPRFPSYRRYESILRDGVWKPDARAEKMLKIQGECFRPGQHDSMASILGLDCTMMKVLEAMAELTVALDHYCRGGPGAPTTLDVFANNTDWVAHILVSMRPYHGEIDGRGNSNRRIRSELVTSLLEVCRLCSLLYLDLVILPTPPHTGVRHRNSGLMLPLIRNAHRINDKNDNCIAMFLNWAIMLGAIATRFTELHTRYIDLIKRFAPKTSWETFEKQAKRYLWFDRMFDHVAQSIWAETWEPEEPSA